MMNASGMRAPGPVDVWQGNGLATEVPRMRFSLMEPTALGPYDLLHLAQLAEECGFHDVALNDGTFQMRDTVGVYPYSGDNRRNWDLEAPLYEPMTSEGR